MKKILLLLAMFMAAINIQAQDMIETRVPERPAGQRSVLKLRTPKLDVVRVGFVGLGMRGPGAVSRWCQIEGTQIVALCDVEKERVDNAQNILKENGRKKAAAYYGDVDSYKEMCERKDIDIIYICTDWIHHVPIALYAMEHGKHVAIEVPAATNMTEIWDLINTAERTQRHCMMLENCVYDFYEMACLGMAQKGLFGEVLHVEGSYLHNLDDFWDEYWNNWRLDFNHKHRGDVYPTHGIGPDCQVLNMHRGDRMDYLVAMDTKPANGPKHVRRQTGEFCFDFQNGDQTSTMIRTVTGKTILIQHDVMTPRPYSRMYQIVGTDGYAAKYPVQQICLRDTKAKEIGIENQSSHSTLSKENTEMLIERYSPDFVKDIQEKAKAVGGHGGMDYIMDYRLVYCLRNGLALDMDVYDLAEWCCISELSRISIENGSMPVAVPDFTRGGWHDYTKFDYEY